MIPKELYIMLIAASPVVELRGAIPLALFYDFPVSKAFFLSLIGNLIPVPLILITLAPLSRWIRKFKFWSKLFDSSLERTRRRAKIVERFKFLGLVFFVAIPLPGTGAWTGSLAASIFGIRFRYALLAITIGVIIAGCVVTLLSIGGIKAFQFFI